MRTNKDTPIIILAFANDYKEKYLANLRLEREGVSIALEKAVEKGLCQVEIIYDADLDKIVYAFNKQANKGRITVFHFAGHGNEYSLQLDDKHRAKNKAYADGFASFLGAQNSLKLVFLNACLTQKQATLLHQSNVPVVISTQTKIQDNTAKKLAVRFYGQLAAGDDLGNAFQKAVNLVKAKKGNTGQNREVGERDSELITSFAWSCTVHPNYPKASKWSLLKASKNPLWKLPMLPQKAFPNEPFPNLAPYDQAQYHVFGSRNQAIFQLYEKLTATEESAVLLLYGAVGVGKTSLLKAGLLPRLIKEYTVQYFTGTNDNYTTRLTTFLAALNATTKPVIIIIDELRQLDQVLLQLLKKCLMLGTHIKVMLSISQPVIQPWKSTLELAHVPFSTYRLDALQNDNITNWMHTLNDYQEVTIIDDFAVRLATTLTNDTHSPVGPFLQWSLTHAWKAAVITNPNSPTLQASILATMNKQSLWTNFLLQQMRKVNPIATENGLLLNILSDCATLEKPFTIMQLEKQYPHLAAPSFKEIYHQLMAYFLVTHPTINHKVSLYHLTLGHELLRIPLMTLLHQSNRPGQVLHRLITQKRTHDYDATEIALFDKYEYTVARLPVSVKDLLNRSKANLRKEKNRKRAVAIIQFLVVTLVLSLGFYFENPYFLLYVILLAVLYR
ncbi:MAG: CHAT domain-containing protein [Bacteroidota bacterium]